MTQELPTLEMLSMEEYPPVGRVKMGDYYIFQFGSGFVVAEGERENIRIRAVANGLEAAVVLLLENFGIDTSKLPEEAGGGIRFVSPG